jgi:hypothetical protein
MVDDFVLIGGYINVLAGLTLLVYWYAFALFMPYGQLSTTLALLVRNRNWSWINTLGVFGALMGLLGQASIYMFQLANTNLYASLGFYIASAGTTLLIGTMLWETVLWPILQQHDEALLSFTGPIYQSKVFLPFFIVAGLVYSLGYVLVGVGIVEAGVLPRTAGIFIAIGAPSFGLGLMFGKFQVYVRSLGVTLMSVALIWMGFVLLGVFGA